MRASAGPDLTWNATERPWEARPDSFSVYRSGFEIRTYRRCHRVLMFHNFEELGKHPNLVRSTEFDYHDLDYSQTLGPDEELAHAGSTRFASFIRSATQSGYVRHEKPAGVEPDSNTRVKYLKKSLPPLEFEYTKAKISDKVQEVDIGSLEILPVGVDGSKYQWVDLDGEGISGVLSEQADAWFYKPNTSPTDLPEGGKGSIPDARFGPAGRLATKPAATLSTGRARFLDLAGDGQLDVAVLEEPGAGFYERTPDRLGLCG